MTHATSPALLQCSSRKVKPNMDPDFEYVQMRIDQIDHELAASGMSPHVSSPTMLGSLPPRPTPDPPVASQASNSMAAEIQLAKLQRDKLALELKVLKLCNAENKTSHEATEGAESIKSSTARKERTIDRPHMFCGGAPISEFEKLELADFVAGFLSIIKP